MLKISPVIQIAKPRRSIPLHPAFNATKMQTKPNNINAIPNKIFFMLLPFISLSLLDLNPRRLPVPPRRLACFVRISYVGKASRARSGALHASRGGGRLGLRDVALRMMDKEQNRPFSKWSLFGWAATWLYPAVLNIMQIIKAGLRL